MTTRPGLIASLLIAVVLVACAMSIDVAKASGGGFKGDESTYYVLAHSLARDGDFEYERHDLIRVWEEYPGPQGIFLKRGKDIEIQWTSSPPFVRWIKHEDPERETRFYFSKSYIYPLVAAPFVFLFGTNGFLVLHALLLALDFLAVYLFVFAVSRSSLVAIPLAGAFLGASVVPVYFVWLVPELFNFSLVLLAVFFWAFKEVAGSDLAAGRRRFLVGPASDYMAAILIALATFSKPSHPLVLAPMIGVALLRRQWTRAFGITATCAVVTAMLFGANAAITGEFSYQGGDRKTFYHHTGFPLANSWETFDNIGPVRGREDLMVGDVLVNAHTATVLRHNLWYFLTGRNAGLLPYFLPGVLATVLFLIGRQGRAWQWLTLLTIAGAVVMHVFVWPFTWNGGGGPVGSRYFLGFYGLFLVMLPAAAALPATIAAAVGGALFTAQILLNPFQASLSPGQHPQAAPLRWLPIELTLINDLPVAQNADRFKRPVGPPDRPQALAYFLDDNAFNPEQSPPDSNDWWFWVKGRSTTDVVLRAPVVPAGDSRWVSKVITQLHVDIRNGGSSNRVEVTTGRGSQRLDMSPGEEQRVTLEVPPGVPFRREVQPTSYVYTLSVSTSAGFVPFLEVPCTAPRQCPSDDSRFLGAMIHIVPEYTDAETTNWAPPGAAGTGKEEAGGLLDAP